MNGKKAVTKNLIGSTSSIDKRECLKCGKKEAIPYKGSATEFRCNNCGTILVYTPQ